MLATPIVWPVACCMLELASASIHHCLCWLSALLQQCSRLIYCWCTLCITLDIIPFDWMCHRSCCIWIYISTWFGQELQIDWLIDPAVAAAAAAGAVVATVNMHEWMNACMQPVCCVLQILAMTLFMAFTHILGDGGDNQALIFYASQSSGRLKIPS
jgi:hypothetical protein